jgi:hypothetical protein
MGLFAKKKMTDEDRIAKLQQEKEDEIGRDSQGKDENKFDTGNPKFDIELTKIHAQLDSFAEIRKATNEQFSRIGEQIGELRGMIMDTNKTVSTIEVSATKAVDLVESVQPEKLMVEMRKQEGKVEALKANIESNEAMSRDIMSEIKKMRDQMNLYRGVEQVIKLNEEIKHELMEIKKVEATIERHSDKVETVFLEVSKKFADFDKFNDIVKDLERSFNRLQGDFDKIKVMTDDKANKKEFVQLLDKFNDFEKHTGNILKLLDSRSKNLKEDMQSRFENLKEQLSTKYNLHLRDEGMASAAKEKSEELVLKQEQKALADGAEDVAEETKTEKKKMKKYLWGGLKKKGPGEGEPQRGKIIDAPSQE